MGFSKESYEFLFLLSANNEKSYFEERRKEYEEVILKPLKALAQELAPFMLSVDPAFDVRPVMGATISRIYRDTRFSKDKSPFRDHMWISYKYYRQRVSESFGFFFEISPRGCRLGMGMYCPDKQRMDFIRAKIQSNPAAFEKLVNDPKLRSFALEGESYKRKAFQGPMEEYLNRKSLCYLKELPVEAAYDPKFAKVLEKEFDQLVPLYQFYTDGYTRTDE